MHTFAIYLVTEDNQAKFVYEGESSGETKHFQTFSLGDKASRSSTSKGCFFFCALTTNFRPRNDTYLSRCNVFGLR